MVSQESFDTQIIPSSELNGLENALAELDQQTLALTALRVKAESLAVTTAAECGQAEELLVRVRAIKKIPAQKINPFLEITDRVTKFLRNVRTRAEEKAEAIENLLTPSIKAFLEQERLASEAETKRENERRRVEAERIAAEQKKAGEAQAEQNRKNREKEIKEAQAAGELNKKEADKARKQAAADEAKAKEQAGKDAKAAAANVKPVTVQPAVPKVAGIRPRLNWRFRIINWFKIPDKYRMPDEMKIGAMVRSTKDKAKAEAECPGIEVYTEDSV